MALVAMNVMSMGCVSRWSFQFIHRAEGSFISEIKKRPKSYELPESTIIDGPVSVRAVLHVGFRFYDDVYIYDVFEGALKEKRKKLVIKSFNIKHDKLVNATREEKDELGNVYLVEVRGVDEVEFNTNPEYRAAHEPGAREPVALILRKHPLRFSNLGKLIAGEYVKYSIHQPSPGLFRSDSVEDDLTVAAVLDAENLGHIPSIMIGTYTEPDLGFAGRRTYPMFVYRDERRRFFMLRDGAPYAREDLIIENLGWKGRALGRLAAPLPAVPVLAIGTVEVVDRLPRPAGPAVCLRDV